MTKKTIFPPGSKEAVAAGCLCPVSDNHGGKGIGYVTADGLVAYWYDESCRLHGGDQAEPIDGSTLLFKEM